jgi:hypothetical protein
MDADSVFVQSVRDYKTLDGKNVVAVLLTFKRLIDNYYNGVAVVRFYDGSVGVVYEDNGGRLYLGDTKILRQEALAYLEESGRINRSLNWFPETGHPQSFQADTEKALFDTGKEESFVK